jgi:class 3 adenylate cyclase
MEKARLLGELRQRTEEVAELNRGLETRVAEQVDELGHVGRLKRFLAPQLAELIVSQGDEKILESHRREIVVVFCDLRGYTAFTETAEPEEVLDFLREYHGALGPLVSQFEGTLDQFSGDGIMVFFNDPVPCAGPAERAVKMAMAMRAAARELIAAWSERGRELGFGAGVAQGYATLGQIGFSERSGCTAIGTACNVAVRLCAEAKDGQILLSQRVNVALKGSVATEQLGPFALKGLTQPVVAYNVPLAAIQQREGRASMPEAAAPRILISYSHDNPAHCDRVMALAGRLRADGIDTVIDQYIQTPPEGWPAWCAEQIDTADFVLMVCTETYLRRASRKEEPGAGHGVLWEGPLINQYLYDAGSVSAKFVPVLLADGSDAHVPLPVKGGTIYRVETPEGYESLLRLLSDQPLTPMPPLGTPRSLPPRERRTDGAGGEPSSLAVSPPSPSVAAGPSAPTGLFPDGTARVDRFSWARFRASRFSWARFRASSAFELLMYKPSTPGLSISELLEARVGATIQTTFSPHHLLSTHLAEETPRRYRIGGDGGEALVSAWRRRVGSLFLGWLILRHKIAAVFSATAEFFRARRLAPVASELKTPRAPAQPPTLFLDTRECLISDLVDVSAFAPEGGMAGTEVIVQVFLHRLDDAAIAEEWARAADPDATRRGTATLVAEIARGKRVDIRLEGRDTTIDEPLQSIVWRGEPSAVQFLVTLPKATTDHSCSLRVRILLDQVPIGSLRFALKVSAATPVDQRSVEIRGNSAARYHRAFLSYATPDRPEVLKRAQALRAADIQFFQDFLSIEPGERWERHLHEEIDRCDLFLLFWSSSAARSEWVLREAQLAAARQNTSPDEEPDITPIILEGPPVPQPIPDCLKHLQFNDYLVYLIDATERERRAADLPQ